MKKIYIRKEEKVKRVAFDKVERYYINEEYTEEEYEELFKELKDYKVEYLKDEIKELNEEIKYASGEVKYDLIFERDELLNELKAINSCAFNDNDFWIIDDNLVEARSISLIY